MRTFIRSAVELAAASCLIGLSIPNTSLAQPCPGQGSATLTITSAVPPAPGQRISLDLLGAPSRPFAVAADVGPGPVVRPNVGTICLDLGPRLVVLFNGFPSGSPALDAAGRFTFGLNLPPRAALGGRTFYMQAFVMDPAAPNGIALSPRLDVALDRAIVEDFATTARLDAGATTADWSGDGFATGRFSPPRDVDIEPTDVGFLLPQPLETIGSRIQFLYKPNQLRANAGESILGASWGPRSNFVFASTYSGVSMFIGHAPNLPNGLNIQFASNYSGAPTQIFSGDYVVSSSINSEWFPWPQFSTDFEYDAVRDLVLEVNVPPGASTFQLFRASSTAAFPRTRVYGPPGAAAAIGGEFTIYHHRFTIGRVRSIAQSLFYDTGVEDPDYSAVAVRTAAQPAGSQVAIEVEGAEDLNADGAPDPGTFTGFGADPNAIDGSRLVRFRVGFRANPSTGEVPRVTSVAMPFR